MPQKKQVKKTKVKSKVKQKQKQTVKVVVNVNSNNKKRVIKDKQNKSTMGGTPVNLPMSIIQRTPDQFLQPPQPQQPISIKIYPKDEPPKGPPLLTYQLNQQPQLLIAQSATMPTPTSQIDGTPPPPPSPEGKHPLDPSSDFRTPPSGVPFSFDERRASLNPVFNATPEKEEDKAEGSSSAQKRETLKKLKDAMDERTDKVADRKIIERQIKALDEQIQDLNTVVSKDTFLAYQKRWKITTANRVNKFAEWRDTQKVRLEQKKKDLLSSLKLS